LEFRALQKGIKLEGIEYLAEIIKRIAQNLSSNIRMIYEKNL